MGCVPVCASVHECERECAGVAGCAQVCTGVRKWAQVCASVHRCVWKCMCVCECVWDEFSEYLLENRVPTSADFNTYPIRIFACYFDKIQVKI